MADRLYPPNIAGTLPSFYTDVNGTTELVVPFSMNQSVSVASVKGFFLRLKRTTTDTLLTIQSSADWDSDSLQVTFRLDSDVTKKMTTGDYYKVQIAYYNLTETDEKFCGHYSTVSIVKYTEQPTVTIQGLESGAVNSVSSQSFTGKYQNSDISEKAYQYRFLITSLLNDSTGLITQKTLTDTGWLIHNSTNDTELTYSTDTLILTELLATGVNYTVQYFVITNNGLQITSPQYSIAATQSMGEILPCNLFSTLDYDNARIRLTAKSQYTLDPEVNLDDLEGQERAKYFFDGNYQLVRTDSNSNFKTWNIIYNFQATIRFEDWEYYDYIIESGVAYRYGLQKINSNNVRSVRCETASNLPSYFEDAFLYDGTRQLRIRYNANVSSIKDVIAESKKTTLGSKYPFVLRNGNLNYKEFPLTGLLSYLSDNDELFMTKEELLHPTILNARKNKKISKYQIDEGVFIETTDQTDENVTAEKNFALFTLSWLNNGSIKLFKSSQEGNYIVKCLNNSLAPMANTNRMLHTFSCTIDEVQEYSPAALMKYDILNVGTADSEGHVWSDRKEEIEIHGILQDDSMWGQYSDVTVRREKLAQYDFTKGRYVTRLDIYDATPGDLFKYGDFTFVIPQSGKYTIINSVGTVQPLNKIYMLNDDGSIYPAYFGEIDQGFIHMEYKLDVSVVFEGIDSNIVKTYYGWSGYGDELASGSEQSENILWEFTGPKKTITQLYQYDIHSYPLRQAQHAATQANNDPTLKNLYGTRYGGYLYLEDINPENHAYYKFNADANEFQNVVDYNLCIRVGDENNPLINIKQQSDDETAMPYLTFESKSEAYWTVGSNVWSILYMQIQETSYALESTNPTVYINKQAADAAKLLYYKLLWNFEDLINKPKTSDNIQVYVYNNDRFSAIQLSEWDNYDAHYKVSDITYTAEQIKVAYNNFYQKQKAFEDNLQYYIDLQAGTVNN